MDRESSRSRLNIGNDYHRTGSVPFKFGRYHYFSDIKVCIGLAGRRTSYRPTISAIDVKHLYVVVPVKESTDVRIGVNSPNFKR